MIVGSVCIKTLNSRVVEPLFMAVRQLGRDVGPVVLWAIGGRRCIWRLGILMSWRG